MAGGGGWFTFKSKLFNNFLVRFMFGHFSGIPNLLRNISAYVWTFFRKGEGGYLIPKPLRSISACVWTFFRRGGGGILPDSKDNVEHVLG